MNRTLRRPMFRTGGSAEGITSGLSRQGYERGRVVNPGGYQGDIPPGVRGRLYPNQTTSPRTIGADTQSPMDKVTQRMTILDAMYPREKTSSMAGPNFLMNFGVDLATRPRSGNILQQAAASAKNPLLQFQQEKLMEQAAGAKETSEDRALLASMLEGMDDEKLSALMKDVKAGVDAGEFPDEATGIKLLLQKKIYGVLDEPGEKRDEWIKWYMTNLQNKADVDPGIARAVAEHQYKIDFKEYHPNDLKDMNRTKLYIKDSHKIDTVKDKDSGEVEHILADVKYDYYYSHNQIYFDPQTGNLFKRVSKKGKAPVFTRIFEEE